MEKIAILNYQKDGVAFSPFSVSLIAESGLYAIKTKEGDIVIAGETAIAASAVGLYKYTFDVTENNVYLISWKIIEAENDNPKYIIQEMGPFNQTDKIDASTECSGTFRQNAWVALFLKITTFEGFPVDAKSVSVLIRNETGDVTVASTSPLRIIEGYYVLEWLVPYDFTVGKYEVLWTYFLDDEEKQETQNIVITTAGNTQTSYSIASIAYRMALEKHIHAAQNIPVYFEQSKKTRDRKNYDFTFKKWNQSASCRIYRNGEIISEGFSVDFFNGRVKFDYPQLEQDVINADYNFRWFSDDDLDRFIDNAVQILNTYPPQSGYSVLNIPNNHIPVVLYGASKDALRQLMMSLMFQEPQQVFGGGERADKIFGQLETLKKNYEEDWKNILEQKKFGRYPSISMTVTPEYTLPGGRCISLCTKGLCKIDGSVFETNMEEILKLHKQYPNIQILSQNDETNDIVFAPINHIWLSGEKDVYEIKTELGYSVKTSKEHLFFVNNKYIPLMDMQKNDNIIVVDKYKAVKDRVKSITKLRRKEIMCDLEIYKTANLFANGIKCHNSRWFRQLFGGSGAAG